MERERRIDLKENTIDLLSISGHKFHGPKGIGALYVRCGVELPPMLIGGGQESRRRPGTEAVHQVAGFGAAADYVTDTPPLDLVRALRDRLESGILQTIPNTRLNGTAGMLPNTTNISFENTNGEAILARLDDAGICVSTGSACASADHAASPVLQAMNVPYSYAMGSIRFSLGRYTTEEEIDYAISTIRENVARLRELSPLWEMYKEGIDLNSIEWAHH